MSGPDDDLALAGRFGRKELVAGTGGIAISSHPVVTRAAVDVLRDGGNACDAALTAAAVQTVVEPHMSTITGVLSLLHHDATTGATTYVNGSAAAPSERPPVFAAADVPTGLGVAVPGWWAGFEAAAGRHGTRSVAELLAPAIAWADAGFPVSPFLHAELFAQAASLGRDDVGRETFFPDGVLLSPGERLRQPRVAETLAMLAEEGSEHFYRGAFAQRLVATVRDAGGVLSREDLESYEARWMEPARGTYRGYDVVASPPPDQGGSHLIEMLNMVELLDLDALGHPTSSPDALTWLLRIHNEVFTAGARQRDPRSHELPLDTILSKEWAAIRLELLRMDEPTPVAPAPPPGSCQITVVDADGDAVTLLHSCMSLPWVNGMFVDGVSVCAAGTHYLRALPEPGDRISAIIAPNLLLTDGRPFLVSGSPSQSLLAAILQNVVNVVDFGMDLATSVALPRFGGPSLAAFVSGGAAANMVESDIDAGVIAGVRARGVPLDPVCPWFFLAGSFEGVGIDPGTRIRSACGDPRRYSTAEAA